jgi:hypothetical protein
MQLFEKKFVYLQIKTLSNEFDELFGELHEQEEYGLFGKEHQHQQCFLYSVRDCTSSNNRLKMKPVFDGINSMIFNRNS